jgi:hypothetical protein
LRSHWLREKIGDTKEAIESDAIETTVIAIATAAKTARGTTALTVQPITGGILQDPGNVAANETVSRATATTMATGTSVRVTLPTKARSTITNVDTDTRKESLPLPNR